MRVAIAAALMGLFVMTASAGVPVSDSGAESSQNVIVVFHDDVSDSAAAASDLARLHGAEVRHVYNHAIKGVAANVPTSAIAAIQRNPQVALVELERAEHIVAQDLPTGIDRIEVDKNPHADVDSTDDVRVDLDVAVIDTGIDLDHPDLNVGQAISFSDNNPDDGSGHGTHVAGTIGALDNGIGVVGVAPGATVHAVKVCKNGGICFTGDIVAGIDWVAEQKSTGAIDFAAANMSISTSDDKNACTGSSGAVHQAICGLVNKGVVFSLAAGNDGRIKDAYPEAMAVAAIADFDGKGGAAASPTCRTDEDDTLANFSNYGPEVDIAAPGTCILSTWNDGGYNTISGTSMAAPHAAGAVALYLHANGKAPATDAAGVDAIEAAIINAALPQGDTCSYTDTKTGGPLLFVNEATFGGDGTCDLATDGGGGDEPNSPPTASFTFACTDLACDFDGSGSSDTDGSINSYDWDFGDGSTGTGETVSHTYGAADTYTVTLTVTDNDGATDSESQDVMVSETATGDFALSATGYKVRGLQKADLTWEGATSTNVDIYRDGGLITTTANDGFYTDNIDQRGPGSYIYKVCEAGTSTCSNEATVDFG